MLRAAFLLAFLLRVTVVDAQVAPTSAPAGRDYRVVAYYPEWATYGRKYQIADVPAEKLTHLIYAFAKITKDGEVTFFDRFAAIEKQFAGDKWDQPVRGNLNQIAQLKQKHPKLQVLIAIGGWTLSGEFSNVALTEKSRERFARSAAAFMKSYGFDGIDIDWEYPVSGGLEGNTCRKEDKRNFTLLMQELRRRLDEQGKADGRAYLLSAAVPAGFDKIANMELREVAACVDWMNVMTYDYHGAWEDVSNHMAPMRCKASDPNSQDGRYCIEWTIGEYLRQGVNAKKMLLGIPLYCRAWGGLAAENNGLFQKAKTPARGTWPEEPGMFDYKDLYEKVRARPEVYVKGWDEAAGAAFVHAPTVNGGVLASFEDEESIAGKIDYVKAQGMGGVFFWELSGDVREGEGSIVERVGKALAR